MGTIWKDIMLSFLMGMVVPSMVVHGAVRIREVQEILPEETVETEPVQRELGNIQVRVRTQEQVTEQNLEAYLTQVVLAEMPASFEAEALKAQAVAARTYTARAAVTGGKHGDGSVCTESTCCQAYLEEEAYLRQGGTTENLAKVRRAVFDTAGQVLLFGEELAEATYFSCSGGRTEDALAVWGTAYPYLVSVESPGEEAAVHYRDTVTFTPEAFADALNRELTGPVRDWVSRCVYTEAGTVSSITICGETYTGMQLRGLLGLRSAAFSLDATDAQIQITTKGHGHRVGMSQYGADAMAVQGSGYREILSHYYPGTTLAQLGIDESGKLMYYGE